MWIVNQSVLYDEFPAIALFWKWVRIFLEQLWLGNDEQLVIKQTTYGSGANEMRCHYKQVWKSENINLWIWFIILKWNMIIWNFRENMKNWILCVMSEKAKYRYFTRLSFFRRTSSNSIKIIFYYCMKLYWFW